MHLNLTLVRPLTGDIADDGINRHYGKFNRANLLTHKLTSVYTAIKQHFKDNFHEI